MSEVVYPSRDAIRRLAEWLTTASAYSAAVGDSYRLARFSLDIPAEQADSYGTPV